MPNELTLFWWIYVDLAFGGVSADRICRLFVAHLTKTHMSPPEIASISSGPAALRALVALPQVVPLEDLTIYFVVGGCSVLHWKQ